MRVLSKAMTIGVLLAGTAGAAHAAIIDTYFTPGMTSMIAGATVYDFNTCPAPSGYVCPKPTGYSGAGSVLTTSISGMAAAPAGDNTPYLSVAYPNASGLETFVSPGSAYNYFGLYWGSIDDYNSLFFYSGASLVAKLTGLNVIQAGTALGNQTAPGSNRYVNFLFRDSTFDRIVFSTTQYAFESDNHTFARVPVSEPATLTLLGMGLFGLILLQRRRKLRISDKN